MTTAASESPPRPAFALGALSVPLLWVALLAASLLPAFAGWQSVGRLNDDSYITLTYVKSLVTGDGWRYNGGAEALGTTTPLFALWVALLARLLPVFTIEQIAVAWSVLSWWFLGWTFALAHRTWGLRRHEGQLLALIIVLQGGYWYATLGMEATFLLAGVAAAAWLATRGHAFTAGLTAALLFLIRPEGLAMLPLAGAWLFWRHPAERRALLLRFAIGAAVPLALWAAYALATFGAILPNSAAAKLEQGDNWSGVTFTGRLFTEWLPGHFGAYGPAPWLSALIPLGLTGLAFAAVRARPLLLILAWVATFLLAYTLLEAPPYWWYMLPVLFAIQLAVALGWAGLLTLERARLLTLVLLVAFLGAVAFRSFSAARDLAGDRRAGSYKGLAAWLDANTPPGSTVAYIEIGYLGYFGERPVVDLVGLIDPRFTANGATLDMAANFRAADPDYLVYVEDFAWMMGPILQDPAFPARYQLVTELPSPFAAPLRIYARAPR